MPLAPACHPEIGRNRRGCAHGAMAIAATISTKPLQRYCTRNDPRRPSPRRRPGDDPAHSRTTGCYRPREQELPRPRAFRRCKANSARCALPPSAATAAVEGLASPNDRATLHLAARARACRLSECARRRATINTVERTLLQRIHNPRGHVCGCDADCWCRRTPIGRLVKWWFPARRFGIHHTNRRLEEWKRTQPSGALEAWKRDREEGVDRMVERQPRYESMMRLAPRRFGPSVRLRGFTTQQ